MRKAGLVLLVLLGILWGAWPAMASTSSSVQAGGISAEDAIDSLDLSELENFKTSVDDEIATYTNHKTVKEWLLDFISGDWEFSPRDVFAGIIRYFCDELLANSGLLAKLIILSVLAALLLNLQQSFSSDIGKVAYLGCFLAMCTIAVGTFKLVLSIGQNTIDTMNTFMMGMLPQMMVLVAGLGNINGSVMMFPLLMTAATAFASAIKNIVFPLIIMSAALHLVNGISETIKVERLAKFMGQMAQILLGFFLTSFVGVVTLRSLYASALDKVTLRTTRFVTDNAIPVVGKMVGDTVEVAAGYVVLLKQALGIWGVIVILGIIIYPLLEIAVLALVYKLVGALVEPMGDARTAAILEIMSNHLFLMMAATAAVALMFFIMIAIVVGMYTGAAVR
ncbi:MAG TPA: stage III sporulation protein AE [Syntrophomonas sp.]|nr:stage III sporulation protein AE [Syntrophomonas sp.]